MLVLEQIVEGSTAMFERLAQFEDFHYTVDLPILVSAAQEKVIKWLAKWQPKKGRLFSWFSKCAKNAFRSELVKVNQYFSHEEDEDAGFELLGQSAAVIRRNTKNSRMAEAPCSRTLVR